MNYTCFYFKHKFMYKLKNINVPKFQITITIFFCIMQIYNFELSVLIKWA